jgi:hypothetical protein
MRHEAKRKKTVMRHEDPYDLLAGGKQHGEPLLTGGELISVRISELETTPVMIPSAATGPHNLNGLRESFRTFRRTSPVATSRPQDLNGLRESFRTFRQAPPMAATGPQDFNGLRESFRTFRQALSMAATGSQDRNGLRESFRTFRREVAGHRP